MRVGRLAANQLSAATFGWLVGLLSAIDCKDTRGLEPFLSEGCRLQVNNDPVIEGRAAIFARLPYFAPSFRTVDHELLDAFGTDSALALETLNHCTRTDGTPVTLRSATFIDREVGGRAISIRLYTDTTDLYL